MDLMDLVPFVRPTEKRLRGLKGTIRNPWRFRKNAGENERFVGCKREVASV